MESQNGEFFIEKGVLRAYRGPGGVVRIPAEVRKIGDRVFQKSAAVREAVIPDGVCTIGVRAFAECTALQRIRLPASLTAVSGGTFCGCTGLEEVEMGGSESRIGIFAFYGCTSLRQITLPPCAEEISPEAFANCPVLKEVATEASVLKMERTAFWNSPQSFLTAPNLAPEDIHGRELRQRTIREFCRRRMRDEYVPAQMITAYDGYFRSCRRQLWALALQEEDVLQYMLALELLDKRESRELLEKCTTAQRIILLEYLHRHAGGEEKNYDRACIPD